MAGAGPALLRLRASTGCSSGRCTPRRGVRRLHASSSSPADLWAGVGAIAGTVLLVGLVTLAAGRPLRGHARQGRSSGCGCCRPRTPGPIGVPRAMLRTLAARRGDAADRRLRRGGAGLDRDDGPDRLAPRLARPAHRLGGRRRPARRRCVEEAEEEAPRQVVNLTAMRLVPASPTPPRRVPSRGQAAAGATARGRRPSRPSRRVTPRQGLGWPLVGDAPARATPRRPVPGAAGRAPPPTPPPPHGDRTRRDRRHRRAAAAAGRSPSTPARQLRGARPDPGRPAPRGRAPASRSSGWSRCRRTT